ncbi:hypothetical protein D9M73_112810 [compost metagenome]
MAKRSKQVCSINRWPRARPRDCSLKRVSTIVTRSTATGVAPSASGRGISACSVSKSKGGGGCAAAGARAGNPCSNRACRLESDASR